MLHSDTELGKLERQARDDLATLAYPGRDWVEPVTHSSGQHVYDVVVVGAGQSGIACGFALARDGVSNVLLIDRNAEGSEGVWDTFARMETLRTPKMLVGVEGGFASLSARRWYEATYGREAWAAIDRVGRQDWMRYLRWLRGMCNLAIENETALESIEPDGEVFALRLASAGGRRTVLARYVVLATGYDGGGEWRIPAHIETAVPPERCFHSNGPVDFDRMRGKRVGILGHGASAFDNACAALAAGAGTVDLCFRRPALPTANPHRWIEFGGFLKHFPDLDDATRWKVEPPFQIRRPAAGPAQFPTSARIGALCHASGHLVGRHPIRGRRSACCGRNGIEHRFDHVICATGIGARSGEKAGTRPLRRRDRPLEGTASRRRRTKSIRRWDRFRISTRTMRSGRRHPDGRPGSSGSTLSTSRPSSAWGRTRPRSAGTSIRCRGWCAASPANSSSIRRIG